MEVLEKITKQRVLEVAETFHRNQVDKAGEPYILHPKMVARKTLNWFDRNLNVAEEIVRTKYPDITSVEVYAAAMWHDILEDTECTEGDLYRTASDIDNVVGVVKILTKPENISREAYLNNVLKDPLATLIKIHDISHNMDMLRMWWTNKDMFTQSRTRTVRYSEELQKIQLNWNGYMMDKVREEE